MTKGLEFKGYWREIDKNSISLKNSGIYCVYRGVYNPSEDNLSLKELIYIGESHDVNERIQNHEKLEDWIKHLKSKEIICYSCAPIDSTNRVRVEAAMIYKHKPIVNIEYKDNYPFPATEIITKNKNSLLAKNFTVR